MNARARDGRVMLDPKARILASTNGLQVVQLHGVVDLVGKDLEKLHERLAPMLDGSLTRDQLAASAGKHAAKVHRYLDGLSKSGALCDGQLASELIPDDFPQPRLGVQCARISGVAVAVTLVGPEARDQRGFRLSFASGREIERRLLELRGNQGSDRRFWVACDTYENHDELRTRAAIARYLLALELVRNDGPKLAIFRLVSKPLVLQRQAVVAPPNFAFESLLSQLGLLRLDRPQLPLVAMTAELPALGQRRLCYGLDAETVSMALTVRFFGREALAQVAAVTSLRVQHCNLNDGHVSAFPGALTGQQCEQAHIARTPSSCAEALVCEFAAQRRIRHGQMIDLVAAAAPSQRVAFLQDALRYRGRSLRGTIDDRLSPLHLFDAGSGAIARVGFEETLAEALLRAVVREINPNEPDVMVCVPTLLPSAMARRRLRRLLTRLPERVPALLGRIRHLGSVLHFGLLSPTAAPLP